MKNHLFICCLIIVILCHDWSELDLPEIARSAEPLRAVGHGLYTVGTSTMVAGMTMISY